MDVHGAGVRHDALHQPGQHVALAELNEEVRAQIGQPLHALNPTHRAHDLLFQQRGDLGRVAHGLGADVGDHRETHRAVVGCVQVARQPGPRAFHQ